MAEYHKALGARVRELRRARKVTQEQLAEKAGLSLQQVGEIERGRGNPTLTSQEGLATALGVTLADLFDLEQERLGLTEIREQIALIVNNASEKECRSIYRILRAMLK